MSWHEVRSIFEQATELPAERREAFLDQACGADAELRSQVEQLLQADGEGSLLQPPDLSGFFLPDSSLDFLVGEEIGGFEVVGTLNRGGMGIVFEARQEDPERTVALKMIRAELSTPSAVRRFRYESEVLAQLQHPYVAQVFKAGTHRLEAGGLLPWFAMEYVEGALDLVTYARREHLDLTGRLQLFQMVCEAVQYGHERGIIHRDLKPGNILVDRSGHPRVIDFGLARASSIDAVPASMRTEPGIIAGTLPYSSPEQLSGGELDTDTRTDVYGLGAVLYELITGQPPFDVSQLSLASAVRSLLEQEPPRPGSIQRRIPQELDWVVLKALSKRANQRYPSVAELSADLGRLIRNEAVQAGAPSTAYRVRKLIARHRTLSATLLVFLASTLTAGFLFGWQQHRKARAVTLERDVARAVLAFQMEMLEAIDPSQAGTDVKAMELFENAAQMVAAGAYAGQPQVNAAIRNTLGLSFLALGALGPAEEHLAEALRLRRELGDSQEDTLDSIHNLAFCLHNRWQLDAAKLLYREALEGRRRLYGETHLDTLMSIENLAALLYAQGELEEAERLQRQILVIHGNLSDESGQNTAALLNNLAETLRARQQFEEAEELCRKSLALTQERDGEASITALTMMNNLAEFLKQLDRPDEAEELLYEVLEISEQVLPEDHPDLLTSMNNLGSFLYQVRRDFEAAQPLLEETLRGRRAALGREHAQTVTSMVNLAYLYRARNQFQDAEKLFREALGIERPTLGDEHPDVQANVTALASVLRSLGRSGEAQRLLAEFANHR
jgi:tetratricopeptide (TPR) repeat protein